MHKHSYKIFLFLHADFTETVKIVQKLEKRLFINILKKNHTPSKDMFWVLNGIGSLRLFQCVHLGIASLKIKENVDFDIKYGMSDIQH